MVSFSAPVPDISSRMQIKLSFRVEGSGVFIQTGQIVLGVFIYEKCHASRWQYSNDVRQQPLKQSQSCF